MGLPNVSYRAATATKDQIWHHLSCCNEDFTPHLSTRVDLGQYAQKLSERAMTFEAWHQETLIGLVAAYFSDTENRRGFITSVSTVKAYMGQGISKTLVRHCVAHAKALGFREICLEVHRDSCAAIQLYHRCGFEEVGQDGEHWHMTLTLVSKPSAQAPGRE